MKATPIDLIYEIPNHSTSCPYFLFVTQSFFIYHIINTYINTTHFQNFLIVCYMHNIISSCTKNAKRKKNTSLTKAILKDEKTDYLVLLNHKVCNLVCISYILAHTKYNLQNTGPSGGKIISFNDE